VFKPFSSKADRVPQHTPLAQRVDSFPLSDLAPNPSHTVSPAKLLRSLQIDLFESPSGRRDLPGWPGQA